MKSGTDVGEVLARGIARLRSQRGLTQERLAEMVGISVPFVAKLEQGAKAPSLATISDICRALGVRASELFAAGEAARAEPSKPELEIVRVLNKVPADRRRAFVAAVDSG